MRHLPIDYFTPTSRLGTIVAVSHNYGMILFIGQLKVQSYFLFYVYLLLFSYSCTFHVTATCNPAILQHFEGCIPTSALYSVHGTENLEQFKGTLCVHPHQKKNGQIDPDTVF